MTAVSGTLVVKSRSRWRLVFLGLTKLLSFRTIKINNVLVTSFYFAIWVNIIGFARGENLSNVDFSLRLPAALSRFSPYSDVAGAGGASIGSPYKTSLNPAATDWDAAALYPFDVSPQYSAILFDRGLTLHVASGAASWKTNDWGTLQPAVALVRSVSGTSNSFTLLDGEYAQIQWGQKFTDQLAIGVNVNYTSLDTKMGSNGSILARNTDDTYDIRSGILGTPLNHLLIGAVFDYAISPSTSVFPDFRCMCLSQLNDTTYQALVRSGVSFEYADKSSVLADYQHGIFWNSTGTFSTDRVNFGIEHQILPWLYARVGVAYDLRGVVSPTAGIGIYPINNLSIDIAFQSNMFPELVPELGRSKLFSVSAALAF